MDNDATKTRDDRSSLLAAFARSSERTEGGAALVTMSSPAPIERVIGAQKMAIYRDEQRILERLKVLAAAAGAEWYYRFPVKTKGGSTEFIEGPSIKLANDLARLYGNCEVTTNVIDLGDSWLIYARFTDFETGFVMTRPFQQRKGQRGMRTESDRALDIAFQIGASKAIRNVVINSLQTFADFAFEEARNALVEKIGRNLEGSRGRALERLAAKHIEFPRVERVIGRAVKDWTAPDIAKVVAMLQSIEDGMTTIDDVFPPIEEKKEELASPPASNSRTTEDGGAGDQGASDAADQRQGETAVARDPDAKTIEAAYQRGKQAKAAGHQRRAMPPEFRDEARAAEAEAWSRGFDGRPLE
jgi:hypothetical protein